MHHTLARHPPRIASISQSCQCPDRPRDHNRRCERRAGRCADAAWCKRGSRPCLPSYCLAAVARFARQTVPLPVPSIPFPPDSSFIQDTRRPSLFIVLSSVHPAAPFPRIASPARYFSTHSYMAHIVYTSHRNTFSPPFPFAFLPSLRHHPILHQPHRAPHRTAPEILSLRVPPSSRAESAPAYGRPSLPSASGYSGLRESLASPLYDIFSADPVAVLVPRSTRYLAFRLHLRRAPACGRMCPD